MLFDKNKILNGVALENNKLMSKGKNFKLAGIVAVGIGLISMVVGEAMQKEASLKIYAVNNEAADMMGELFDIWYEQHK